MQNQGLSTPFVELSLEIVWVQIAESGADFAIGVVSEEVPEDSNNPHSIRQQINSVVHTANICSAGAPGRIIDLPLPLSVSDCGG